MKKQSPVQRIWELGRDEHGRLITAVVMAVAGVVCGMAPYFAAARIIVLLLAGETALEAYTPWLAAALCGYLLRTARSITARCRSSTRPRSAFSRPSAGSCWPSCPVCRWAR